MLQSYSSEDISSSDLLRALYVEWRPTIKTPHEIKLCL